MAMTIGWLIEQLKKEDPESQIFIEVEDDKFLPAKCIHRDFKDPEKTRIAISNAL